MRTIHKSFNVYSFNELSESAKQNAIDKLYDINVDYEWWDSTYEDAENIGLKINEFDLDRASYVKGEFIGSALDTANRIIKDHGEHCDTYVTAKSYLESRKDLVFKYSDKTNTDLVTEENEYDFDNDCDDLDVQFLKSLCEDYRIMLSREYDYLTSKEAIIETIEANDYEFLEDGTLYNS